MSIRYIFAFLIGVVFAVCAGLYAGSRGPGTSGLGSLIGAPAQK